MIVCQMYPDNVWNIRVYVKSTINFALALNKNAYKNIIYNTIHNEVNLICTNI